MGPSLESSAKLMAFDGKCALSSQKEANAANETISSP